MVTTFSGNVTLASFLQPSQVLRGMTVMLRGKTTVCKLSQPASTYVPKVVRDSGKVKLVIWSQL